MSNLFKFISIAGIWSLPFDSDNDTPWIIWIRRGIWILIKLSFCMFVIHIVGCNIIRKSSSCPPGNDNSNIQEKEKQITQKKCLETKKKKEKKDKTEFRKI